MNDRNSTTRKAAILIASLERATAEALLAQMSGDQAETIIMAIADLGPIDPLEQEAVIEEFFRIGPMLPEHQPAGIELDSEFAERISGFESSQADHQSVRTPLPTRQPTPSPFRSLHDASGATLAARLRHEHPQTIAVVVSHLPAETGADLLSSLSPALQSDVARRLVDLEETDSEILLEIEQGLESWLHEHERSSRRRTAGMMALQNILAATDPLTHETMLSNLARHDRRLVKQLEQHGGRLYAFAELQELDDSSLSKVFSQVDHEVLAIALAGAGKALVARAYRVLPVARAARLRRDLDRLGPMDVTEMEQAQLAVAEAASELDERGQLKTATGRKLSLAA